MITACVVCCLPTIGCAAFGSNAPLRACFSVPQGFRKPKSLQTVFGHQGGMWRPSAVVVEWTPWSTRAQGAVLRFLTLHLMTHPPTARYTELFQFGVEIFPVKFLRTLALFLLLVHF